MKLYIFMYVFCLISLTTEIPLRKRATDANQDNLMLEDIAVNETTIIPITSSSTTTEDRFFWENDYVGKPVNFYHGAAYQIPVIEGEIVEIQCKVRAVSEDSYTII